MIARTLITIIACAAGAVGSLLVSAALVSPRIDEAYRAGQESLKREVIARLEAAVATHDEDSIEKLSLISCAIDRSSTLTAEAAR